MTKHQVQWAAQFVVGAELIRRGYSAAFFLGNQPVHDLICAGAKILRFKLRVSLGINQKVRLPRAIMYPSDAQPNLTINPRTGKPCQPFAAGVSYRNFERFKERWDRLPPVTHSN